jgi:hypothetical protein
LAGLAGLLVYDKFASYVESINYLGLYKVKSRDGRRNKKYNHRVQRYLVMLANTILHKNGEKRIARYRDLRKILEETIDLKKSIGLAGDGAGLVALARPTRLSLSSSASPQA